jgi:hypothetical protein
MIETVRTSKTSALFNETTRRYISESFHFETRCRENLKSHGALGKKIKYTNTELGTTAWYRTYSNFLAVVVYLTWYYSEYGRPLINRIIHVRQIIVRFYFLAYKRTRVRGGGVVTV